MAKICAKILQLTVTKITGRRFDPTVNWQQKHNNKWIRIQGCYNFLLIINNYYFLNFLIKNSIKFSVYIHNILRNRIRISKTIKTSLKNFEYNEWKFESLQEV